MGAIPPGARRVLQPAPWARHQGLPQPRWLVLRHTPPQYASPAGATTEQPIMSYTRLMYHIVFRTKNSVPALSPEHESAFHSYVCGIIKNKKSVLYRIGGMPDHVHILMDLHPSLSLADFMRDLKTSTHHWLNDHGQDFPFFTGWGTGYAAFSYSLTEKETIINYIANQKTHHQSVSFADEYRQFIEINGCQINEMFFLKD